jgi:hypothetical protein
MDRTVNALSVSPQASLNDRDIAHIARVMGTSLRGDLAGPILPAAYWRKRLHQLLDTGQLSHAQLCAVDSLLLQLDQFEAKPRLAWDSLAPASAALFPPPFPAPTTPSA